ncbi:MAG: amidohydrolase family protein [Ilumatobacteraceae bacterium]
MATQTHGIVCAHHHLYSSLVRGMPAPKQQSKSFIEILNNIWWRVDAALDNEMIYWSAMLGATEALMSGTTCIIDHHESPNSIEGSLNTIAEACKAVGVRINTCYGVTDRWDNQGQLHSKVSPLSEMTDAAKRGLAECDRYLTAGGNGMVGVHAAFTCSDETLLAAAELAKKHSVGVHIHVAEGVDDVQAGARLESITQDNWLLIHAVHLDRKLKGRIVHNARSNMNNAVGYAKPTERSNKILLGTDGIGADMIEEARIAYARLREFNVSAEPTTVWQWLENSLELFPDAKQDVVSFDYDFADSPWHAAFTTNMNVTDVEIAGEKVLTNSQPTRVDLQEVRAKANEQALRLYERLS